MKERIIGATVLVLFVVLVVPVFLDGPENDNAVISQTVPLPGQSGEANQTIVLHRDREHPVPVATSGKLPEEDSPTPERPDSTAAELQQAVAVNAEPEAPQPAQEPAVEEPPADNIQATPEPVASATGMWAVQLGSFGNQENADKLAADLRKQNYTAFLSKLSTGDGDLHRVRIGPQKDRESAEQVAAQLAKAGHKGQVVPHP